MKRIVTILLIGLFLPQILVAERIDIEVRRELGGRGRGIEPKPEYMMSGAGIDIDSSEDILLQFCPDTYEFYSKYHDKVKEFMAYMISIHTNKSALRIWMLNNNGLWESVVKKMLVCMRIKTLLEFEEQSDTLTISEEFRLDIYLILDDLENCLKTSTTINEVEICRMLHKSNIKTLLGVMEL